MPRRLLDEKWANWRPWYEELEVMATVAALFRGEGDAEAHEAALAAWKESARTYHGQCVYFAQRSDGLIKIGWAWSGQVQRRVWSLGSYRNPQHLRSRLLVYWPGDREVEAHIQRMFAYARVEGEWFRPVPDLMALIEQPF
jgi:alpha-L-fucosidase